MRWAGGLSSEPGWGFAVGALSLVEVSALLTRCDLLVSVDSGLMHLASSLGVPVLAIFGPTDPARSGPFWGNNEIIRASVNDATYDGFRYPACPRGGTLVSVKADQVVEMMSRMMT